MIWALIILIFANIACGLVGPILVLKKMVMSADAISHSVLLGIVLAFFIVGDLTSPWLIIGAAIFGILTLLIIEWLIEKKLVASDGAIGLVFPVFFALAVVLISRYARNVHLDTDIVLMGEVIFTALNKVTILGITLPKTAFTLLTVIFLNLAFILLFYKEIKFSIFDEESFKIAGFKYSRLHHLLLFLVSLTCVAAFDAIGAILVIAYLAIPTASAYLVTKSFSHMIVASILFGILSSVIGYHLSIYWNVSMQMLVVVVAFVIFMLTLLVQKLLKLNTGR